MKISKLASDVCEVKDLVRHEGDERRNNKGTAGREKGRKLICQ